MNKLYTTAFVLLALLGANILPALAAPPTVPGNVLVTELSTTSITISWSASTDDDGVAGYRIFRNGSAVAVATTGPTILTFTDTGLAPASTYSYTVKAFDLVNNESLFSTSTAASTLSDVVAPSIPVGLVATVISSSQINLTWSSSTDNVGVANYSIFQNNVQVASSTATSLSFTGLLPATTYSFNVTARDIAGNVSGLSSTTSATTLATSTPPTATPIIKIVGNDNKGKTLNLKSNSTIRVVVFGSSSFDARTINTSSVKLSGASATKIRTVDYNRDGIIDQTFDFKTKQMTGLLTSTSSNTVNLVFSATTNSGQQLSANLIIKVKNYKEWKKDHEKDKRKEELKHESEKKEREHARENTKKIQERMKEKNKHN